MKVIFTNGCFDILHRGHIEYLKQSKALGDWLVVGLNSDESVRRLKPGRPLNNQEDRKALLLALRFVDEVYIFNEDTPSRLLTFMRPAVVTKGGDYKPEDVVSGGAAVAIIPTLPGYSTTRIINAT